MIKVGLIGFGHWGPNLLRNFSVNPFFDVVAIADREEARQKEALLAATNVAITAHAEDLIMDPLIDAILIATPATTHYDLACEAINQGKHVLVEKPLCTRTEEGRDLLERAEAANVVLMVDHTILFTGAFRKIREICNRGELGKICYFDSSRVNLGLFQKDVNVLWDLAPHDFSVVDVLFKEELLEVEAHGYSHLNSEFPDIVYLTMHFVSNKIAHLNMSWMSPVKRRQIVIGGTHKMLVWDDVSRSQKVKIYDSGIIYPESQNRGEVILPQYRKGPIVCPRLSNKEALANVVDHFAAVIMGKQTSIMDGHRGLRVVQMLEKTQKALDKSFSRIRGLRERSRMEPALS